MRNPRGTAVSSPDFGADLTRTLQGLGEANLAQRGIGFGTIAHGKDAGKLDAVWVVYDVPNSYSTGVTVDIAHTLKRIPTMIQLVQQEGTTGHAFVTLTDKDRWSATSFRAIIRTASGTVPGLRLSFLVS